MPKRARPPAPSGDAEESLRQAQRRLSTLLEHFPDLVARFDGEGRFIYVNPASSRVSGAPPEAILGRGLRDAAPSPDPETNQALHESVVRVFRTGKPDKLEATFRTVEGPHPFEVRHIPERDEQGKVVSVLGIATDLAERRRAEAALRAREQEYRTLAEHTPDIIVRWDADLNRVFVNPAFMRLLGRPTERPLGTKLGTGYAPEVQAQLGSSLERLAERVRAVFATGVPGAEEFNWYTADGVRVIHTRLIPERAADGSITTVLGLGRDITDRYEAETALRASEERFRQVTESIDEVFWLTDSAKTELIYVSPAYDRVFGQPREVVLANPRAWIELIHPEDRPRVIEAMPLQVEGNYDLEYRIIRADGLRWIHERAFPILDKRGRVYRVAGVAEDITIRRELEAQLRQAQKMEAVGQLAGGIAHDFNNMLAVIHMQASLLLDEAALPASAEEGIREILAVAARAANLTQQLLTFSRRRVSRPVDLDPSEVLQNVTKLLRRVLGEHITLEARFAPSLPHIHADPAMMEQVLMNLAINARDAMEEGGRLTMALEATQVDPQLAARHPGTAPGPFVCLTVTDTGSGIPPEALPHIFEPFFSTKEVGKGTGLGLATVFAIVEQHHGWIEVESVPQWGTTFRVFLPATGTGHRSRPSPPAGEAVAGGSETILLVEDDPSVRSVTRAALEHYGYRVLEADCATSALEVWARDGAAVDLLLTDLIMPGDSGRRLAEVLLERRPGLRVIYTSGYSPDVVGRLLPIEKGRSFLQKPYTPAELAARVRLVLDETPRR